MGEKPIFILFQDRVLLALQNDIAIREEVILVSVLLSYYSKVLIENFLFKMAIISGTRPHIRELILKYVDL